MKISFDPHSENYWGREMYPMELEGERNKKKKKLHKRVRNRLNNKKLKSLRWIANDLLDWETPETRVNNLYKQPGFWIVPPSTLSFYKCRFSSENKFKGSYKFPFYLIFNEELNSFLNNSNLLTEEKGKLNKQYSEKEIQYEIDNLENNIEQKCFDLYAIVLQYAKYLIWAIDTSPEVEDYQKSLSEYYGKPESISQLETAYYGAVFGSEYAIYELIDFFVREKDKLKHIEILKELKPLAKRYICFQITKAHYKRGSYGDWERSKGLVKEVLENIGEINLLTEERAINIIREYSPKYMPPESKRKKIVDPDGFLVKSTFGDAMEEILKVCLDAEVKGDTIKRKIDEPHFSFKCEHWKQN